MPGKKKKIAVLIAHPLGGFCLEGEGEWWVVGSGWLQSIWLCRMGGWRRGLGHFDFALLESS